MIRASGVSRVLFGVLLGLPVHAGVTQRPAAGSGARELSRLPSNSVLTIEAKVLPVWGQTTLFFAARNI